MRTALISLIAMGCLVLLVGVLTLTPLRGVPVVAGGDKLHHVLGFAAIILPVALLQPRWLWWAAPLTMLYGGVIEIIQPMVGRGRELADFYADCIGVVVGLALGLALRGVIIHLRGKQREG